MKRELNEQFRDERMNWDDIRPNDAAGLLKQLIRELPVPLLTLEYYDAFAQVEGNQFFIQLFCTTLSITSI